MQGEAQTEVTCDGCGHTSTREEPFECCTVAIAGRADLFQCLGPQAEGMQAVRVGAVVVDNRYDCFNCVVSDSSAAVLLVCVALIGVIIRVFMCARTSKTPHVFPRYGTCPSFSLWPSLDLPTPW